MAKPIQDSPGELWKPVVGFEGSYEVSNLGRVRGVDRIIGGPHGPRLWKGRVLRAGASACGRHKRLGVMLLLGGKFKTMRIHRLVMAAFIGPCPKGLEVCHNDGNASNNHLANLRYDTRSENIKDQLRHGTHKNNLPWAV